MNPGEAVTSAYAALAQRAWMSNRARAAELTRLVDSWQTAGGLPHEGREQVREIAHSLRGSAGTFGHDRAAEAAQALELLLVTEHAPQLAVVADLVAQIHVGLADPPVAQPFPEDPEQGVLIG